MSRISSYEIVSPVAGDIVIGTDVSNANKAKNFRVEDIAALAATPTSTLSMTAQTTTGQTPSALDTALQIKFGSAQTTTSVSIDANGLITFLEAGDYRLNVNCCFYRNAISGYSNTQFGIFYNSAGGAPTVAASPIKSFTSDERQRPYMYYEDLVIKVVANSTLVVKMLNDTSLTSDNSTNLAAYVGTLGTTPSASVLIYSQ